MHPPLRYALRVTSVSVPLGLVSGVPATAAATTPVGWEEGPPVSLLEAVLIFGGVPLGLFLLITFLTVAPGLTRGDRSRGVDRWATPQWFNGPRAGESVEGAAEPRALGGSAATGGADSYAGASPATAGSAAGGASAAGSSAAGASAAGSPAPGSPVLGHSPAPGEDRSGTGPGADAPTGQPAEEARGRRSSPDADAGPARDVVPVAADTGGGASARW